MQIELNSVNKYYNRGQHNEVYALKNISFSVQEGEIVCIRGPSGSGKSTLLSIIGCLYPPTSGTAIICGRQIARLPDHFLTRHRRENIGFIFQRFNLIESLTVLENITLPLLPLGVPPAERTVRARKVMEELQIGHREKFRVNGISGGEMQRVAIGRALINNPRLLLADEPTAHLDPQLRSSFMDAMADLKKSGKTIVITSHDIQVTGHPKVDRCFTMEDGTMTAGDGI
ncbi:MAG: ABC transporter ATP-binding protein [Desulfopila sp.]|jgi:putative ABC transport system ATP-binding protein|nr:ABC transporter ATP-binding protein [Desulfopila sp.]